MDDVFRLASGVTMCERRRSEPSAPATRVQIRLHLRRGSRSSDGRTPGFHKGHHQIRPVGDQRVDAPSEQSPRVGWFVHRPDLNTQAGAMRRLDEARCDDVRAPGPFRDLVAGVPNPRDRPAGTRIDTAPSALRIQTRWWRAPARRPARRGGRGRRKRRDTRGRSRRRRGRLRPWRARASTPSPLSSTMIRTSRYLRSTSASVGTPIPRPRNGKPPPSRKKNPASARDNSPAVRSATGPAGSSSARACRRDGRRRCRRARGARRARGRWRRAPGRCRTPPACFPGRARSRPGARRRAAVATRKRDAARGERRVYSAALSYHNGTTVTRKPDDRPSVHGVRW